MPGVARLGDILGPGGVLTAPVFPDVTVNGRPVAVLGTAYSPHFCCGAKGCPPTHCFGTVIMGDFNVTVHGVPVAYKGAPGLCGHSIMTGSSDVQVGGAGLIGTAVGLAAGGINKDLGDLGTEGAFGGTFSGVESMQIGQVAQAGFSLASGDVMGAISPTLQAGASIAVTSGALTTAEAAQTLRVAQTGVSLARGDITGAVGGVAQIGASQAVSSGLLTADEAKQALQTAQVGFSLATGDIMGAASPVIKAGVDTATAAVRSTIQGARRGV